MASDVEIQIGGSTSNYEKSMRDIERITKRTTDSVGDAWKKISATVGGYWAFSAMTGFIRDSVRAAGESQKAMAGMEQALRSVGRYTPALSQQLQQLAKDIQSQTTFEDDAVIAGQKFLVTYGRITNELLPRTTRAMVDLAAFMGTDLKTSATMLGKASEGMVTGLKKVGIVIDESKIKGKGFAAVLDLVEKQIGAQAAALASTGIGPWEQLNNLWGDSKESIGELELALSAVFLPAFKTATEYIKTAAEYWKDVFGKTDVMSRQREILSEIVQQREKLERIRQSKSGPRGADNLIGFEVGERDILDKRIELLQRQEAVIRESMRKDAAEVIRVFPTYTPPTDEQRSEKFAYPKSHLSDFEKALREYSELEIEAKRTADTALLDLDAEKYRIRIELATDMNAKIKELSLNEFDYKRFLIDEEITKLTAMAGEDAAIQDRIAEYRKRKMTEVTDLEAQAAAQRRDKQLSIAQEVAGGIADTFQQISQAGGKSSAQMFKIYQAFSIIEASISAYKAIAKTLAEPALPFPLNVVMAGVIGAKALMQVAMISAAQPPSYDQGGISTTPGMYYSGIPEAHIPLVGGAVPVRINGGSGPGGGQTFNVILSNPTFQDLATQQAVMAQIASVIAAKVAPGAVTRSYQNDGPIRQMIRARS